MKLKTIKSKVIAWAVAVVVISGSSVVYANTESGEWLKNWYNGMFNQTVESIDQDVDAYTEAQMPGVMEEYEALKSEAAIDIDLTRELETGKSLEEIVTTKLDHIESLDAEEQEILANIGLEFYNVFLDGYFEIERLESEGLSYATNDLTAYTTDVGEDAVTQLTDDLTTAKNNAVSELEEAIRQAQERLAQELENQEEITTRNLMNQVDWAIEDLRVAVTELLNTLVAEQEAIIVAKAQELEDEAKAAMDEVISSMGE